jgi:hypothetical protein
MTPKEKAFELAHKFRLLEIRTSENSYMMISMADAKKCALVAVDEILDVIVTIYDYDFEKLNPYWEEVKQEIEKL